jgi:hypothetical protein
MVAPGVVDHRPHEVVGDQPFGEGVGDEAMAWPTRSQSRAVPSDTARASASQPAQVVWPVVAHLPGGDRSVSLIRCSTRWSVALRATKPRKGV